METVHTQNICNFGFEIYKSPEFCYFTPDKLEKNPLTHTEFVENVYGSETTIFFNAIASVVYENVQKYLKQLFEQV